jgi:hypothetical protein
MQVLAPLFLILAAHLLTSLLMVAPLLLGILKVVILFGTEINWAGLTGSVGNTVTSIHVGYLHTMATQ